MVRLNWAVLKDKKWWVFQSASLVAAALALVFAMNDNGYWVLFVALSMVMMVIAVNRASEVTHEDSGV